MDRRCRESEGKAKIEGYMSISDEEAHQRYHIQHIQVSGYNSRANGIAECVHFDVRQALFKPCDGDQSSWHSVITSIMMASLNVHTSMSDKHYSRPVMETNQGGIPLSLPSCGPTESQSTDIWAVPCTSQPPAHTHFSPSISLKQRTCFLHQMLLFPQLTSLLGVLSPFRNVGLTWLHSPPTSTLLESKPRSISNKSMPPPSLSTTSNEATSSSSEILLSRSLSIAKCVRGILVPSLSYRRTRVAPTSSPSSMAQSSTIQSQHSKSSHILPTSTSTFLLSTNS